MDHLRFDALSMTLGTTRLTRNRLLAGLLGVLVAGGQGDPGSANQRAQRRRRRQRRQQAAPSSTQPFASYLGRCEQQLSPRRQCVCLSPYDLKPCITVGDCAEDSGICMPDHGRCWCLGNPPAEPPAA